MTTKYIVRFSNGTRLPSFFDTKEEAEKEAYKYGSYKNVCRVESQEVCTKEELRKILESL